MIAVNSLFLIHLPLSKMRLIRTALSRARGDYYNRVYGVVRHSQEGGGESTMIRCNLSWVYLTTKMLLILLLNLHRWRVYPCGPLYSLRPAQCLKHCRVGKIGITKGGYIAICQKHPAVEEAKSCATPRYFFHSTSSFYVTTII